MELHYFRERIHALGAVVSSRLNRRIDEGHRPLNALRERIAERISEHVPDRDAAALISALAVGVDDAMSREQWRVFNATGTTHLVAISGLHVTLFAVIALAIAGAVWKWGLWRIVPLPRDVFAAYVALMSATGYALLAGFSVPTQRTLIMLAAWFYVRSSARVCKPMTPLMIALGVIVLVDPFAPLSAGFWLSFGAMYAIIVTTQARLAPRGAIREAVAVQMAVFIVLAPLTLAWFNGVSLAGLLVNAVAIPVVSFVFVPLVLLAAATMPFGSLVSGVLLDSAAALYTLGWPWLAAAANSPHALIHASPPWWWYPLAMVMAGLSLLPWPLSLRIGCIGWLIPLAFAGRESIPDGGVGLTLLDTGRTMVAVVRTSNHVLVYGAGGNSELGSGVVEYALLPFLRAQGIGTVDRLVISRLTPQRSAVLTGLVALFPVQRVIAGASAQVGQQGSWPCNEGEGWEWDGVRFRIVFARSTDTHARDCVLEIDSPGGRMLLPGDLDGAAEQHLVQAGLRRADVVVVPRFGSNTASTFGLIEAVDAQWALLAGSREGPRGEKPAVTRWESRGTQVLATGDSGAIEVVIDPRKGLQQPSEQRRKRPTPWRGEPHP